MTRSTSGTVHPKSSAVILGGWFALASLGYFAWKVVFIGLYDGSSIDKIAAQAAVTIVAAVILFLVGLLAGFTGRPGSRGGHARGVTLAVTTGLVCGFIIDFAASLAFAKLLSGAAASLGGGNPGGSGLEAGFSDMAILSLYALGGGIAGAMAGYFYITRG